MYFDIGLYIVVVLLLLSRGYKFFKMWYCEYYN